MITRKNIGKTVYVTSPIGVYRIVFRTLDGDKVNVADNGQYLDRRMVSTSKRAAQRKYNFFCTFGWPS